MSSGFKMCSDTQSVSGLYFTLLFGLLKFNPLWHLIFYISSSCYHTQTVKEGLNTKHKTTPKIGLK